MAVTQLQAHALVSDIAFQARLQVAMADVALAIQGENVSGLTLPDGSQYATKRAALASRILNGSKLKLHENNLIPIFGYAVVALAASALDPAQQNITDNYLKTQVINVFNDIAGVNFSELPT